MLEKALDRAGKLDGVLAAPHGAAVVEGGRSVDGEWLSVVRQKIGKSVPLVGTCDPHANLSQQMVDAMDAVTAYRTNPHLDQRQQGVAAAELLLRTIRGEIKPVMSAAMPPMAISIERQLTSAEPCAALYRAADAMLARPGVLSNSIVLGFPYADVPAMGSATIVVTDGNRALAQSLANELAGKMWEDRESFRGQLVSVESAVGKLADAATPVCLLDMGDNVGGGSPGDGTVLAHALERAKAGRCFVSLYDPAAAQQAVKAGVGASVRLSMGGKVDRLHGEPLVADVVVRGVFDGRFAESQARHGGMTSFDMGPTAIVETAGGLVVQLTTQRVFPVSLGQLTSCGLDPASFRAIVAKGVHAPLGAYAAVCPTILRVNTPGVTSADLNSFDYRHRRRPMFPLEADTTWK